MITKAYIRGAEIPLEFLDKKRYLAARVIYVCDQCGREGLTEWRKLREYDRLETQTCPTCSQLNKAREMKKRGSKYKNKE